MTDLATLPTTRDEDWRYADAAALEASDADTLTGWTEITVPAGESVAESRDVTGVERIRVRIGKGGRFELSAVNAAPGYARLECEVTLEDGAHFEFGGVTIGGGSETREFVTRCIHAEPNATSNQVVRAVHWGKAIGNFLGRIEVVRDAQKTDAGQNFRAILLEKGAAANTKPELEIFADDVKCAHGAAIGALDQMAGFYMAARGIPPEIARKLQVQAFIADAFENIEDEAVGERLLERALSVLEGAQL
ncbi:SufD family Fe-S cluster assembly protein [Croceicoccus gelatinilyticus]|uniref:SufD family Fe-S cluster assembly protein n=1 Tax=Croceicoccus gelatinilyticus TaxID=2835536 RepID=UPI001BCF68DD|nr:SufD family Fe-S cluster assembly protein [Croceicoccus gelatinilyticus]